VNKKHRQTLKAIFENPVRSNVLWSDVEKLLIALGAELSEGRGFENQDRAKQCASGFSSPASAQGNRQGRGRFDAEIFDGGGC
jgi:hypothetical protein